MKSRHIDLSTAQIAGSALAAITGTICASYLGVGGTLIGAAFMSAVSTAGTAIYRYYLSRTGERLKTVGPVVATRVRTQGGRRLARVSGAEEAAGSDQQEQDPGQRDALASGGQDDRDHDPLTTTFPAVDAAAAGQNAQAGGPGSPVGDVEDPEDADGGTQGLAGVIAWLRPRWLKLAGVAAGIFIAVIGVITVVEAVTGKPVSSAVWGKSGSGTTIGDAVTGSNGGRPSQHPSNSPTTPAPASSQPGQHSTAPATTSAPEATPTTSSASPTPSPSGATSHPVPTTRAPNVRSQAPNVRSSPTP